MDQTLNRIAGGLFGLAIGDALGGTTEFMKKEDIKEQYGYLTKIIGGGIWELEPGETTDDTAMTIAVAKGIIANPKEPIEEIGKEFINWFNTQPKDVGITVLTTINNFEGDWFKAAEQTCLDLEGKTAGNGTLMRCLPISLAYDDDIQNALLAVEQSRMTHYSDEASSACFLHTLIAGQLMLGADLKKTIEGIIKVTPYVEVLIRNPDCLPDGYVVNTFKWVLRVLLTTNSFEEVVQTLTNMGEDSDTTAAIAGGLAGIYYGYESLPLDYKEAIFLKSELMDIANKLYKIRQQSFNVKIY